jgi:hypothetical protein
VLGDLDTLKQFVVDYYVDYNVDMTEDWNYSWTFSTALLFTLTIMTTIGEQSNVVATVARSKYESVHQACFVV